MIFCVLVFIHLPFKEIQKQFLTPLTNIIFNFILYLLSTCNIHCFVKNQKKIVRKLPSSGGHFSCKNKNAMGRQRNSGGKINWNKKDCDVVEYKSAIADKI